MYLSRNVLKSLIETDKVITDFADLEKQLTANGFDVRLAAVVEVLDAGKLAIDKADNRSPRLGKAFVLRGFEDRLQGYDLKEVKVVDSGSVKFDRLKPYLVVTCEKVNTPENMMIHAGPRSSLFRLTQSLLGLTFTEAGYRGFLTFMLFPVLDGEVELGARIAQLSFSLLKGTSSYESQKESSYQGGKLF